MSGGIGGTRTGALRRGVPVGALLAAVLLGWLGASPDAVAAPPRFLTLPFASTARMVVQLVWRAGSVPHHAIDYVRGTRDVASTWRTFPVLAAADGEACAQVAGRHGCVDVPNEKVTNRVAIRHDVGGTTYTTVYEDLASISPSIPIGGRHVRVTRGQPLGMTGNGEGNPPDLIHLHFVVLDARGRLVDPYDLRGGSASAYPNPSGTNGARSGPNRLWITDPPTPPSRAGAPASATASSSAATRAPNPPASPTDAVRTPTPTPTRARSAATTARPMAPDAVSASPEVLPAGRTASGTGPPGRGPDLTSVVAVLVMAAALVGIVFAAARSAAGHSPTARGPGGGAAST